MRHCLKNSIECAADGAQACGAVRIEGALNGARRLQYVDNCLPEWAGLVRRESEGKLDGPVEIAFGRPGTGERTGTFPGDRRPICVAGGFTWREPGFHFIRLVDAGSGVEGWSNPVYVTERPPSERVYWGDPHWQTFYSDGIRCPEELYAFATDEGFLDFGTLSDHMEAITDLQWEHFAEELAEHLDAACHDNVRSFRAELAGTYECVFRRNVVYVDHIFNDHVYFNVSPIFMA